jgi:hypothetical protein
MPGEGINGVMEAIRHRQGEIAFVQVRHEEAAAFMLLGELARHRGRAGEVDAGVLSRPIERLLRPCRRRVSRRSRDTFRSRWRFRCRRRRD